MQQRMVGERDPYLRPRVPRERILTVWALPSESARLERELEAFRARLATLADSETPAIEKKAAS
jgi:hypothetical protein